MSECKRATYPLEVKSVSADGSFAGYASVFNLLDTQRDVMHQGAFKTTLTKRSRPVQLLWQHQWDTPIGVVSRIFEDARGLYVEGKLLLEVTRAKEAYALLKAGVVRGLSIGFTVEKAAQNPNTGVRELFAVDLWEVSLVTLPANEAAQVTVVKRRAEKAPQAATARLLHALRRAENTLSRLT